MTPVLLAGALLKTTAWPAKIRLTCCWMGSVFLAVAINSMLMKVSAKVKILSIGMSLFVLFLLHRVQKVT